MIGDYFGSGLSMDPMSGMGGGPQITGKWINKLTGKTIIVRDCIIEGDQMMLTLANGGMMSMTEFSNNYVQASEDVYDKSGNIIGKTEIDTSEIIESSKPIISNSQNILNTPLTNNFNSNSVKKSNVSDKKPVNSKDTNHAKQSPVNMVNKIFDKIDENQKPKITFNINWDNFPVSELQVLIDYFDVSIEDISKVVYETYFNGEEMQNQISTLIKELFDNSSFKVFN